MDPFKGSGDETLKPTSPPSFTFQMTTLPRTSREVQDSQTVATHLQSPSTTTFHLFNKLPIEVRLKIWSFCVFPRAVSLQRRGGPPPAVLRVCSESREATRHLYAIQFLHPEPGLHPLKDFRSSVPKGVVPDSRQKAILMNYDIDVFNVAIDGLGVGDIRVICSRILRFAQLYCPMYTTKVQRIMIGVPRLFSGRSGFKKWWWEDRLWMYHEQKWKSVMLVFGGHKWTRLDQLVDLKDGVWIDADEQESIKLVRQSLENARKKGHCAGLEVRFARVAIEGDSEYDSNSDTDDDDESFTTEVVDNAVARGIAENANSAAVRAVIDNVVIPPDQVD